MNSKSPLLGEGATAADLAAIETAILAGREVAQVTLLQTHVLGADELLVAARLAFQRNELLSAVAYEIDVIAERVREAVPAAKLIFIEPDLWHDPNQPQIPTEAIVLPGSD